MVRGKSNESEENRSFERRGDCPGINAVIHAVVKRAILRYGWEVIGVLDGFEGMVEGKWKILEYNDVSGIMPWGELFWELPIKQIPFVILFMKRESWFFGIFLRK